MAVDVPVLLPPRPAFQHPETVGPFFTAGRAFAETAVIAENVNPVSGLAKPFPGRNLRRAESPVPSAGDNALRDLEHSVQHWRTAMTLGSIEITCAPGVVSLGPDDAVPAEKSHAACC